MNWDGNCNVTSNCNGVLEFIGSQTRPGGELRIHHRLDEEHFYDNDEAFILQYRCSRCGEIKSRFNRGYESVIKQHKDLMMQEESYHFQS